MEVCCEHIYYLQMKIQICISTLNEGISKVIQSLPQLDNVSYLVGHQVSKEFERQYDEVYAQVKRDFLCRSDIEYVRLDTLGLSKSRNELIQLAKGDILLFSDDDVSYLDDLALKVNRAYSRKPNAKSITFQFVSAHKSYSANQYRHSYASAMKVSSIEITARREFLVANHLRFDERFGLGTSSPSGEEFIFITDMLKKSRDVFYEPEALTVHPDISSGNSFYLNDKGIATKGRMLRRVFSFPLYIFVIAAFSIKKYKQHNVPMSFLRFLIIMIKG